MTNGEKLQSIFPDIIKYGNNLIDDTGALQKNILFDDSWWNAEYKEPTNTIDYHRAFKIACDLLNGDILYGVDTDKIYELMMQKDGVVSSSSYEEYILNHLQELDQGQYASNSEKTNKSETKIDCEHTDCNNCVNHKYCDYEPTTKNDLAHNLCDSCTNIGCEFQSGIIRTECAFYMPPQLEPDNCGNYVVQVQITKNDIRYNRVKNELNRVKNELEPTTRNCFGCKHSKDNHNAGTEECHLCMWENQYTPTTKNCESCRYYGSHHEVCNYCYKCSLWTEQELTNKNDLAVDCISRQQAIDAFPDLLPNIGYNKKAITEILQEVPPVTPQEPRKGHWIGGHCSECGCDVPAYIIDWKWQKDMDAKFCPNCGADMREVEE